MENIRLAYTNAQIGKYAGQNDQFENVIKTDLENTYGTGNVTVTKSTNKYIVGITGKGVYQIDEAGNVSIKSGVSLDKTSLALQIIDNTPGEETVTATLEGIEGEISWNSSDTNKATVTPIGDGKSAKVTAVADTTEDIQITATCGRESAICEVNVTTATSISSISVSPTTATVEKGEEIEITATVNSDATETIKWSVASENADKVSLSSQTGNKITVTGLKVGEGIEITAKGQYQNKTATCTVEVEPGPGYFIQEGTTAYYYPNSEATDDDRIAITKDNVEDEGYLGKYLGMKVKYTPDGHLKNTQDVEIGKGGTSSATYDTYRLLYIDVDGYYAGENEDTRGRIYIKADYDGVNSRLDYLPASTGTTVTKAFNKKWAENTTFVANPKTNITYVNRLLDKSIWEIYKDRNTAGIANFAVGAPSLEMWIDSYNAFLKANTPTSGTFYEFNCTVTQNTDTNNTYTVGTGSNAVTRDIGPKKNNDGYGYYVGTNVNTNSGIIEAYYNGSNSDGCNTANNSFVKASNYTSNVIKDRIKVWNPGTGSYWLTSPSSWTTNHVVCVSSNDSMVLYNHYSSGIAFCPLISIKSGFSLYVEKN